MQAVQHVVKCIATLQPYLAHVMKLLLFVATVLMPIAGHCQRMCRDYCGSGCQASQVLIGQQLRSVV